MPIQVKACPQCDRQLSKAAGFVPKYWCHNCNISFMAKEVEIRSKYRNRNKERSDKHEKKAAKKIAGRTTPGSGSLPFNKGDVRSDFVRMECKTTEKKSYSVKKELLLKIRKETEPHKIPVFNIQFEQDSGHLNYYIVDEGWFLQLLELWEKHEADKNDR